MFETMEYPPITLDTADRSLSVGLSLSILNDALARTRGEDMRKPRVKAALDCLRPMSSSEVFIDQFWNALSMDSPYVRCRTAQSAMAGIRRQIGG